MAPKWTELTGFPSAMLGFLGLLFAMIGNFWCGFADRQVTVTTNTALAGTVELPATLTFGIWNFRLYGYSVTDTGDTIYVQSFGYCKAYGDWVTQNTKWKSAMAFTILSAIFGAATVIGMCAFSMCKPNQAMWKFLTLGALFTTLWQGLVFLFFASNACTDVKGETIFGDPYEAAGCTNSHGANFAITSTVIWFATILMSAMATVSGNAAPDLEEKAKAKVQVASTGNV